MPAIQKLDGIWNFVFMEGRSVADADPGMDCPDLMPVPGCFDAQFDYRYRRGCGLFRRRVETGGTVRLTLEGYGLHCRVFWDGREIFSGASPYTAERLVFGAGERGIHELAVATDNIIDRSPASLFQEFYDFYAWGGIYRSVTLEELPELWVERISVVTEQWRQGVVRLRIELGGAVPERCPARIFHRGRQLAETVLESGRGGISVTLPEFAVWSPDSPRLERLAVKIPGYSAEVEFGVREIAVRGSRLLLNGEELKLIGYNRHDAHPELGACMDSAVLLSDLRMIRSQGCNFVRGSHYPQSEEMLSLCDRLGLLVWDESLGWGNPEEALTDPLFRERQLDQTRRMVRRSINHPCVILWGFLNEAATQCPAARGLVGELARAIREEDDSRLVTFASMQLEKDLCLDLVDVISFNTYPAWYGQSESQFFAPEEVTRRLDELAKFASAYGKPLLISEIGAAALPGDHSGLRWSEEFQSELLCHTVDYIRGNPAYSGVALWQFCDGKTYSDTMAQRRAGGMNRKGVLDEYRRPKLAWRELSRRLRRR